MLCKRRKDNNWRRTSDDIFLLSAEITRSEPGNDNLEKKPGNE